MSPNTYLTAAFKSVTKNQAYMFMKKEFVIEDYGPGTTRDTQVYGPHNIGEVFSSLKGTVFAEQGIDSAFASDENGVAYIFSGNTCAKWYYAADNSSHDAILEGPKPIAAMFPFFRRTMFETGVDAAFESSHPYEAYLFKGKNYAKISYSPDGGHLVGIASINEFWPCLRGTTYEDGFDAAFTLHTKNEAYLFKGDSYARIEFTPGTTKDVLRWSGKIKGSWPNLDSILPRNNNLTN
ncbi:Albumin-2 [Bienertia sinuspersici]